MRTLAFVSRNTKEILRDKVNLFFGLAFPLVLLLLLTMIQSNIPVEQFPLQKLAPGISIFGLSFLSLFSGVLISKDRSSSFMMRLLSSPMKSQNFILGYMIPLIPMALLQCSLCFVAAIMLGLPWTINIVFVILINIPTSFIFISIGLICGTLCNDKQVGGICGALLTNLTAWFSGTWFDVSLVGGMFENISNALPFLHAVELSKAVIHGEFHNIMPDILWILGYAILMTILSIFIFTKQMKRSN